MVIILDVLLVLALFAAAILRSFHFFHEIYHRFFPSQTIHYIIPIHIPPSRPTPPPLHPSLFHLLPTFTYYSSATCGAPPECAICLTEFKDGEVGRKLGCDHSFHRNCIDVWLRKTNNCPLCRHIIVIPSHNNNNDDVAHNHTLPPPIWSSTTTSSFVPPYTTYSQ